MEMRKILLLLESANDFDDGPIDVDNTPMDVFKSEGVSNRFRSYVEEVLEYYGIPFYGFQRSNKVFSHLVGVVTTHDDIYDFLDYYLGDMSNVAKALDMIQDGKNVSQLKSKLREWMEDVFDDGVFLSMDRGFSGKMEVLVDSKILARITSDYNIVDGTDGDNFWHDYLEARDIDL